MEKIILVTIILLLIAPKVVAGQDLIWQYKTQIFASNNTFALHNLWQRDYDSLATNIDGTIKADYYNQHQHIFKIEEGDYFFGYTYELEQSYRADSETALFLIERRSGEYSKENYKLDGYTFEQEVEGLIFGKNLLSETENKEFYLIGKLLSGIELVERDYQAEVVVKRDRYYFSGSRKGVYSYISGEDSWRDINFFSYGYSLGFASKWEFEDDIALSVQAKNLHSNILWNDIYTLDSDYNEGGTIAYQKLITKLPSVYQFNVDTSRAELGIIYSNQFHPYLNFKLLKEPVDLKVGFYRKMLNFELNYNYFQTRIAARRMNLLATPELLLEVIIKPIEIKF